MYLADYQIFERHTLQEEAMTTDRLIRPKMR